MRRFSWLTLAILLSACQPTPAQPITIHIVEGDSARSLSFALASPASAAAQAGLSPAAGDRLLLNGVEVPPDLPLAPGTGYTLQVRRAELVTLVTPDGEKPYQSAAPNVGLFLREAGVPLGLADFVSPPPGTPLSAGLRVEYRPARELTVRADGVEVLVRSSAATVGQALAEAGIPLLGLDASLPPESDPLPADGQVRVIRVREALVLQQKPIPYEIEFVPSDDLELDSQNILQAGMPGLAVSRTRIRYEDGVEVSRTEEAETLVRAPVKRVVGYGTKVSLKTLAVPGGQIQYWRAVRMYSTSYSPCRSGVPGKCFYGTASGLPVKRGVVSMSRSWYNQLAGMRVYIPGYGTAVIADVGGGFPDGRPWIDLGFSDEDYETWSGWITVYFLAPIPETIPYILQ
jgi:uncharacterized protein YabE (DUF348 family)